MISRRAHSSSKCNRVDDSGPIGLEVERTRGQEQFGGTLPAHRFTRLCVVVKGDGTLMLLGVAAQVRPLGQVATQYTVGVLVDTALPRAVRAGKEHLDARALGQRLVVRHFLAVVIRHGQAHGRVYAAEDKAKALCSMGGAGVVQLHQHGVERLALDLRADLGLVSGTLDEVALPVAGQQTLADLNRAPVSRHECINGEAGDGAEVLDVGGEHRQPVAQCQQLHQFGGAQRDGRRWRAAAWPCCACAAALRAS